MKINVIADINNIINQPTAYGYLVVRRDDTTAALWYYGFYEDKERAERAAVEINNGLVLEVVKGATND